jgi:Fe-S cluster assembly protein SufD
MSGTTTTLPFVELFGRAEAAGGPSWLSARRRTAFDRFAEVGIPTSKVEDWRFTPVHMLATTPFGAPAAAELPSAATLAPYWTGPESWSRLVLVDGAFAPTLSTLRDGVAVRSLKAAIEAGDPLVERHLGRTATSEATPFAALSLATFTDGVVLHLPAGTQAESPVEVLHVTTTGADNALVSTRVLVVAGDNAEGSLVESFIALGSAPYLTIPVTEVVLGANARVEHVRIQREAAPAWHIGFTHADQQATSHYRSFCLAMGAKLARHDLHAKLNASGIETLLYGLSLADGDQLADTHSAIFHDQPHCNSWEVYKGIFGGRSRGVFNGKVFVQPIAQKTDAKQTNRNLLLSDAAQVDTKPQLEIFADDVKCTHGATVGRLNEQQRYYLRSRGIGGKLAQQILTWAFAAEVIAEITIPETRAALETLVHARLDEMTS